MSGLNESPEAENTPVSQLLTWRRHRTKRATPKSTLGAGANENIVQLPSVLERLATRLKTYLNRDATNRHEWIEIQEGICCTLAEAREEIGADIPFGQWCKDNGFDKINDHDRAAAIKMGNDPIALHACLEVTERRSLRLIYKNDFGRFGSATKPNSRRKVKPEHKPSPEFIKAKAAIAELQAEGATVSHKAVRERAGVSDTPVRNTSTAFVRRFWIQHRRCHGLLSFGHVPAFQIGRHNQSTRLQRLEPAPAHPGHGPQDRCSSNARGS